MMRRIALIVVILMILPILTAAPLRPQFALSHVRIQGGEMLIFANDDDRYHLTIRPVSSLDELKQQKFDELKLLGIVSEVDPMTLENLQFQQSLFCLQVKMKPTPELPESTKLLYLVKAVEGSYYSYLFHIPDGPSSQAYVSELWSASATCRP